MGDLGCDEASMDARLPWRLRGLRVDPCMRGGGGSVRCCRWRARGRSTSRARSRTAGRYSSRSASRRLMIHGLAVGIFRLSRSARDVPAPTSGNQGERGPITAGRRECERILPRRAGRARQLMPEFNPGGCAAATVFPVVEREVEKQACSGTRHRSRMGAAGDARRRSGFDRRSGRANDVGRPRRYRYEQRV